MLEPLPILEESADKSNLAEYPDFMRQRVAILVSFMMIGSLIFTPSFAATKAGAACPSKGQVKTLMGKKFTCVKSGKKLIWKIQNFDEKNTELLKPKTQLSDVVLFSNLDKCKIKDGDPQTTNMTAGFPIPNGRINLVSGSKVQIIGVDFPDKRAGAQGLRDHNETLTNATESFWKAQSTVPVKFEWNWAKDWITMPNSINSYGLGGSFFEGKFNGNAYFSFVREIISIVDQTTDFSGVNFLFIVFPIGIKNSEIGTFLVHTQGTYSTNEGNIYNLIVAGGDYANAPTYIHEFGHALGLTDIRDTTDLGNQKSDGMYYDIMNNPQFPELLVWHRYLLGFLNDNQMHCVTSEETSTHWLSPVARDTKDVKGVVIPLSETEAVIIESRRAIGFDKSLQYRPELQGAVVYTLDSKIPYRRTPVKVIATLKNNDFVTTNGYKISLVESGTFGDVIKVEKAS